MESEEPRDKKLYSLMRKLEEEVFISLKETVKSELNPREEFFDHFLFKPLYDELIPILERSKTYPKVVKHLSETEFVKSNMGHEMCLLHKTELTPENLVALTFFRTRVKVRENKSLLQTLPTYDHIISPKDRVSVEEIFRKDYLLLESLLYDSHISYSSNCVMIGITGPDGIYKVGEYEIRISTIGQESPPPKIARVKKNHLVKKQEIIFSKDEVSYDKDYAENDFLDLVALICILRPDLGARSERGSVQMNLLTFSDKEESNFMDEIVIAASARAGSVFAEVTHKVFDITKHLQSANLFLQKLQKLKTDDYDKISSAMRRFAIGSLRRNPTDSIVDFSTALEGLLYGKNDDKGCISFKLRLRSSVLTKNSLETYEFVKGLYDERSKIVHTNDPIHSETNSYIKKAKEILSEIIRGYLDTSFSLKKGSVTEYLDNLIIETAKKGLNTKPFSESPRS